jgi:hypothetical protein
LLVVFWLANKGHGHDSLHYWHKSHVLLKTIVVAATWGYHQY